MKSIFFLIICTLFSMNSFGGTYFTQTPLGSIKGAIIKYVDSTTIKVTTGQGECNGKYWEITSEANISLNDTDVLTGGLPYGEDFLYIYIDDSAADYPALVIDDASGTDIIASTTEPSWSDSKQGWYNGNDRCIGAVWSPADSYTIMNFQNHRGNKYIVVDQSNGLKQLLDDGTPDGTWTTLEGTAYSPVNSIALLAGARNTDDNDSACVYVCPYENEVEVYVDYNNDGWARFGGFMEIERGWTRDLKWKGDNGDSAYFDVWIYGYQIER